MLKVFTRFAFARNVKPGNPKNVVAKAYEVFDPKKSKYSLDREEHVKETITKREDAPSYLKNE